MKIRFTIILLLLIAEACSPEKKAMKDFKNEKYQKVIEHYKEVLRKQPNNSKANFYVAESYRHSNRIKEAERYYEKAKGSPQVRDSIMFNLAKAYQANAKYDEAKKKLEELEANASDEKMKDRAKKEIDGLQYIQNLGEKKNYYKVKNLEALNTPAPEYGPYYLNGELYFTSSRSRAPIFEGSGTPFTDIYKVVSKGANVDVSTITSLPDYINTPNVFEGCITFSPDGKIMIFAKGNSGKKKGAIDVDLYMSRFRNGLWTEPTQINVDLPNSWESTPSLSPDGRTLYFSSNRKGGYGGNDIYSAQMDSRGRFGKVKNLGPDINTEGDELFPYMADNGKFYFSSDTHPGYGMMDIFVVNRANGKTIIENLGQPMNSTGDDFGLFLFKPDRGFFASNREGGKGDDDIYTFINEDPNLKVVNYYLEGITYSIRKDSTKELLPDTKVTLLDEEGVVMQDFTTGNDGKFLFRVYESENYVLLAERDGYINKRQNFTTRGKSIPLESLKELVTNVTLDTLITLDRELTNVPYRLKNIYFGYDSADIRPVSARELDKLVQLLNDNPQITKIEMGSHTDSVANESFNLKLSQRRADATIQFLIRRGIDPKRLEAKGYGESKPIARNTNPDGTDNPEGRQRNRRTEFRILQIGPAVKKTDEFDEDKYFKDNKDNKDN